MTKAVPLYVGCRLGVVVARSIKDGLVSIGEYDPEVDTETLGACTVTSNGTVYVVFIDNGRGCVEPRDRYHEVMHATLQIARMHGVKPNSDGNDEALAYLAGWIGNQVHSACVKYTESTIKPIDNT